MKILAALMLGSLLSIHAFATDSPVPAQRLKTAAELLHVLHAERSAMAGVDVMIDMMIRNHPMMAPYRAVMMRWAKKYLSWSRMGPKMVRMYANAFTESQLRDLIRFYNTPTGRKAVRELPKLERRGAMIGEQMAMRHTAELQQMIKARAAQLQKASP